MAHHFWASDGILHSHICRTRMVYWYVRAVSIFRVLNSQISTVAYSLGIYLLNLFLAFLQPKFDPSNEAMDNDMEDGAAGGLPTKQDEEFRPFIRRLPEFKFWHSATRAILIGFTCTWFEIFDVPVFWPVLVVYWIILFMLTSEFFLVWNAKVWRTSRTNILSSAQADSTYDQIPIRTILVRQNKVHQEQLVSLLRSTECYD